MVNLRLSGQTQKFSGLARYFVASNNRGGWFVFKEGIQRPVSRVALKINAVETAKVMARDNAPSQVFVEMRDGSFFEKYAFPHAHAH